MMGNIFIKTDPAENRKHDKEKSTEKIDGLVATNMVIDRTRNAASIEPLSVFSPILFIYG